MLSFGPPKFFQFDLSCDEQTISVKNKAFRVPWNSEQSYRMYLFL